MEYLTRSLTHFSQRPDRPVGISLSKQGTPIPVLSFADDTIIFANATLENADFLKKFLGHFASISGLHINYNKSSIQFSSNVPDSVINSINQSINVQRTSTLEKYLGIPLVKGRIKKEVFDDLTQSIKKQLSRWKANSLSQSGRALQIGRAHV